MERGLGVITLTTPAVSLGYNSMFSCGPGVPPSEEKERWAGTGEEESGAGDPRAESTAELEPCVSTSLESLIVKNGRRAWIDL